MKSAFWIWTLTLLGCLVAGPAVAQQMRQPLSVRPVAFDYNRYLQDDAASPSDEEPADAAPAPVADAADAGHASSNGCCDAGCDSCCNSGCDSCCNSGCGLGLECCLGDAYSISDQLFDKCSPWSVGGWTQVGYTDESNFQFNDRPNEVNLHQQWAWLERTANPTAGSWDWGFRADLVYGIDAQDTQAFGNTTDLAGNPRGFDNDWDHGGPTGYGWALPQVYGEIARGDFSVKAGHFYTPIGYEVVQAPDNFFFSHSFTQYNSEPFTHTGALGSYTGVENLEILAGWTLGWDTGFDGFFGEGNSFLGGVKATLTDDASIAYMVIAGNTGFRGSQSYMHSIVLETGLTDKLSYVLQSDLLRVDTTGEDNVGINQYLFYAVNDCFKVGGRIEWWKTDPLLAGFGSLSFYEATFGINYRPHANVVFRPEVRQDWVPAVNFDQTIFGIDCVMTY